MENANSQKPAITDAFDKIRETSPLIHCITHPIASNGCANILLAMGARPIMAEHPDEVAEITKTAAALCLSLGNITRDRLLAIENAADAAASHNVPCIIDLVGVACSKIRQDFAVNFIKTYHPAVIKGNATEIKAIALGRLFGEGVDARKQDKFIPGQKNDDDVLSLARELSENDKCVVMVSGETDIVTDGKKAIAVRNGSPMMSKITGSGCMLNVIAGACMAVSDRDFLMACICAAAGFGVAAELACEEIKKIGRQNGSGSFLTALLDSMCSLDTETVRKHAAVSKAEL